MGDVITLGGVAKLPIPVDRVINEEVADKLETAVVIGWEKDGAFYFASSMPDGGTVLWLLEMAKKKLLEAGGA